MTKRTTAGDRFIGNRIREARIANGQSMKDLAELLGCSWQQVQKYEVGFNRVNGARFDLLVTALRRPMSYFFPNATDVRFHADPALDAMMATKDGQDLARAFARIPAQPDRRLVRDLAMRLAKERA
ncbi:MAG TPA: helix-turn-helix transcriptional regulator [Casimicrobiaceae bacterium]|jgi:transcriptional regulator with XRE-family HTH domain|nr:helix-turn-helix transcriptional regulator [Casimicrobiaceae bacterium]